ncbi:hypothetical protein llap_664 [Limosa lapponica baueri]|uniref:Uncharacterized protein n=1 Tax=Limosa lapponica baueri TaxID=1758121 RepID=A0A2I0USJ1_LIMLA|nr:hypothetical protein llap_664 [Limosa lapponica baueri]
MYVSVRYQRLLESHVPGASCLPVRKDEDESGNAHSFFFQQCEVSENQGLKSRRFGKGRQKNFSGDFETALLPALAHGLADGLSRAASDALQGYQPQASWKIVPKEDFVAKVSY